MMAPEVRPVSAKPLFDMLQRFLGLGKDVAS